jgi:hypothetical protein
VVFIQRQPRPFAGKSIGDVADHFGAVIARREHHTSLAKR